MKSESLNVLSLFKTLKENSEVRLGSVSIDWSRENEESQIFTYKHTLEPIKIREQEVEIIVESPASIKKYEFFNFSVLIKNNTQEEKRILLTMNDSKEYLMSGNTKALKNIQGNSQLKLNFNFMAINVGLKNLPLLSIYDKTHHDSAAFLFENYLPGRIIVT